MDSFFLTDEMFSLHELMINFRRFFRSTECLRSSRSLSLVLFRLSELGMKSPTLPVKLAVCLYLDRQSDQASFLCSDLFQIILLCLFLFFNLLSLSFLVQFHLLIFGVQHSFVWVYLYRI